VGRLPRGSLGVAVFRAPGPIRKVIPAVAGQKPSERGRVETVNGDLLLDEAKVGGQLRTVNGDITVGAASHVGGGILVEDSKGWKFGSTRRVPKIVIGPGAVVDGTLRFEREVKLYVSSSATIGKVEGATPIRFEGDQP